MEWFNHKFLLNVEDLLLIFTLYLLVLNLILSPHKNIQCCACQYHFDTNSNEKKNIEIDLEG
jgi:hypothetical protein